MSGSHFLVHNPENGSTRRELDQILLRGIQILVELYSMMKLQDKLFKKKYWTELVSLTPYKIHETAHPNSDYYINHAELSDFI